MIALPKFSAPPKPQTTRAMGLDPILALALLAVSLWPTWRWLAARLEDSGEEAWGIIGLLGTVLVVLNNRIGSLSDIDRLRTTDRRMGWLPILATILYAASYPFLSPLPRALIALTALGTLLPSLVLRRNAAVHAAGFLFLSLPVMPSLQFYLGYPLRVVSGEVAARLINASGFPVVRNGTLLSWQDRLVFIDAPCSGVKMLWAGMVLALALSALRGHGPLRTLAMAAAALFAVIAANILRTTALFFLETGVVQGPPWAHSAIGMSAFLSAAALVVWIDRTRRPSHAVPPQTSTLEPTPCAA